MTSFSSALVTGASGFIGSALVSQLVAEQVNVICVVRENTRALPFENLQNVRVIRVASYQVSCLRSRLADLSAEVVFNLASYGVQQGDCHPDQLIEGNVGLVTHLLEAVAKWPLRRFIHTGSCSEYGHPAREGKLISETQPLRPLSPYGAAKAASVIFGSSYAARLGIPFITLRLFGVYGTHEGPRRFVPYIMNRLQLNEAADLTAGEQVRDFLFEEDVTRAFLEAATTHGLNPYDTYNVCSSRPVRLRDMGEAVADAMRKTRDLLHWGERPYRPDEPMWLVGDNGRFTSATSWRPSTTLEEGICRMISNFRPIQPNSERQYAI